MTKDEQSAYLNGRRKAYAEAALMFEDIPGATWQQGINQKASAELRTHFLRCAAHAHREAMAL